MASSFPFLSDIPSLLLFSLLHAFRGRPRSQADALESRRSESGCQPQRLTREEDEFESEQHRFHASRCGCIVVASVHHGEACRLSPSAVALREDEPPRSVAVAEVARRKRRRRGRRRQRTKNQRGSRSGEQQQQQGRRSSSSFSRRLLRERLLVVVGVGAPRRPSRLVELDVAPATGARLCLGARMRQKQQEQQ